MTRALAHALLMAVLVPAAAQTLRFDCGGPVKTESVFDSDSATTAQRQWSVVANYEAGYVKRDPELAAGCVERTVEVCGCEMGPRTIHCRSLGITPQGVEVGMDFSIDRTAQRMKLSGRRFDPQSGNVTETTGLLECRESPVQR